MSVAFLKRVDVVYNCPYCNREATCGLRKDNLIVSIDGIDDNGELVIGLSAVVKCDCGTTINMNFGVF